MNSALILAYVGVALMVGLAGIASAVGTAICGQTAVGAMKKNGAAFGSYMILSALPGSQGLYGFVCFFMVQGLLTPEISMFQAAAIPLAQTLPWKIAAAKFTIPTNRPAPNTAAAWNIEISGVKRP